MRVSSDCDTQIYYVTCKEPTSVVSDGTHNAINAIEALHGHFRHLSLQVLLWITCLLRPLDSRELIGALASYQKYSIQVIDIPLEDDIETEHDFDALESLLRDSFIISNNDEVLRPSEATAALLQLMREEKPSKSSIHEEIAYICLRAIEYHDVTLVWKLGEGEDETSPKYVSPQNILIYAAAYWHVHYLRGHSCSKRLTGLLHHVIQVAVMTSARESKPNPIKVMKVGLMIATFYNFEVLGRIYLRMGAQFDEINETGSSPLHLAAAKASKDVLKCALIWQPRLDLTDSHGMTALHIASWNGHYTIVKLLIRAGSAVSQRSKSGETCLHLASRSKHCSPAVIELLLENGADATVRDENFQTPLDLAWHPEAVKLFASSYPSEIPVSPMEKGSSIERKKQNELEFSSQSKPMIQSIALAPSD